MLLVRIPRPPYVFAIAPTSTRHNPVVGITLPLQFRSAAQGVAVRAGDQDAGDAGWTRQAAPDAQGNLRVHVDICININRVRRVRVRWRS